jgi:hypothetical protein
MLLHWNFCIEWFELNSKGNSKSFWKMLWKIGKGKKKRIFCAHFSCGPAAERISSWPSPARGRQRAPPALSRARPTSLSSPLSALGRAAASLASRLARKRARFPSLSVANTVAPRVRVSFFLPTPAPIFFLVPPNRIRLPVLTFLVFERLRAI